MGEISKYANIRTDRGNAAAADMTDERLLEWLGISKTPRKMISEVTYFTCLKMLSETLGKMPIK